MKKILVFLWVAFAWSVSAQSVLEKAQQLGVSPQQIEEAKNNPDIQQQAVKQAQAAGVSQSAIEKGLKEMNGEGVSSATETPQHVQPRGRQHTGGSGLAEAEVSVVKSPEAERREFNEEIFGREVFSSRNLTFAPSFNIATPKDYRLAAGDELVLNIWGASQSNESHTVSPEGSILISGVGPVYVAGRSIQEAESALRNELSRIYRDLTSDQPETFMSLALGSFRSVTVNISGEVSLPGTYTLPSLSTLFNALYMAGGVNKIGSLRNITLYRNNKSVAQLDVYDYLLNGRYDANIRLEDNDMIVVEPYHKLVTVYGKVKRPRIYELKQQESLSQLISIAGGFTGDAYSENLRVQRKNGRMMSMHNVNANSFASFVLNDGDFVVVDSIINRYSNRVVVHGQVYRPGGYAIDDRVHSVLSLIKQAEGLTPEAFTRRALLTRMKADDSQELIALDLGAMLRGEANDVALQKDDQLLIESIFNTREAYTLTIQGAVNRPHTVSFSENMTIEDLILRAGGLQEAAATVQVEVSRRRKNPAGTEASGILAETYNLHINGDLQMGTGEKFILQPFDVVNVRFSPSYTVQESVLVNGEVVFTGSYVLNKKNERLADLVNKAGGITADAYLRGANLMRKMNDDERARVNALMRLTRNMAGSKDSVATSLDIDHYPVGIDLEAALKNPAGAENITLREGDILMIPQYISTVKISGAVVYPNSVTYNGKKSLSDYLDNAGGYTDLSRKRPIVIYANGMVGKTKKRLFWYKYPKVEAGCEILVPMKSPTSGNKMGLAEIMSITSSTTSVAAMVASLINTLK